MSQYNKLSDIQHARFQILPVDLNFGLFWSAGIPTMYPQQSMPNLPVQVHIGVMQFLQKSNMLLTKYHTLDHTPHFWYRGRSPEYNEKMDPIGSKVLEK